jgi:hypothetical protein
VKFTLFELFRVNKKLEITHTKNLRSSAKNNHGVKFTLKMSSDSQSDDSQSDDNESENESENVTAKIFIDKSEFDALLQKLVQLETILNVKEKDEAKNHDDPEKKIIIDERENVISKILIDQSYVNALLEKIDQLEANLNVKEKEEV